MDCSEQRASFSERRQTRDDHHHLTVMCASIAFTNKCHIRVSYEDEGCVVFSLRCTAGTVLVSPTLRRLETSLSRVFSEHFRRDRNTLAGKPVGREVAHDPIRDTWQFCSDSLHHRELSSPPSY